MNHGRSMHNDPICDQSHDLGGESSDTLEAADGRIVSFPSPARSSSDERAFSTGGVLCDRNCGVPSVGTDINSGEGDGGLFSASSNSRETSEVGVGGTYATSGLLGLSCEEELSDKSRRWAECSWYEDVGRVDPGLAVGDSKGGEEDRRL